MSAEIRRVALNWVHPRLPSGHYRPMNPSWKYVPHCVEWRSENRGRETHPSYPHPTLDNYMPAWGPLDELGFQIYETTTEGTPVSPIFRRLGELKQWALANGSTEESFINLIEESLR